MAYVDRRLREEITRVCHILNFAGDADALASNNDIIKKLQYSILNSYLFNFHNILSSARMN